MTLTFPEYRKLTTLAFAASLEPGRWQDLLDYLGGLLDGAKLHMFGYDVHRSVDLGVMSHRHDPEWIEAYKNYYAALNPYPVLAQKLEAQKPYELSGLIPERDLKRTEYFADFFLPQENLTGGVGMVLEATEAAAFVIGTLHPDGYRESLDRRAMQVLGMIGRDLGSAWQIGKRLTTARLVSGKVEGHRLDGTVAILDARGWPVYLSDRAAEAIETGDLLRQDLSGRLSFTDPAAQAILTRQLTGLERSEDEIAPARIVLGRGVTTTCSFSALDPDVLGDWGELFVLGMRQPLLLVDIRRERDDIPVGLLGFDLSRAELDVTAALSRGQSLREIAERRGVSIHTIRNQIKSAMSKCGVSRQSQLVALALRDV